MEFLRSILTTIVFHRNMLKLYRNVKDSFLDVANAVYTNIDYSENLTIGVKFKSQSLHWSKMQVTVHSGLVKYGQEKVYHPYLSDSCVHDQVFVHQALEEIIDHMDAPDGVPLVIESDNCTGQYKSTHHFYHIQSLANEYNRPIFCLYGIAIHGKEKVDHVGGVAEVAVRRSISGGAIYKTISEIVTFLKDKFGEKQTPEYIPYHRNYAVKLE